MQEFFQKNWKKLVLAGLATTAAGLLIYLSDDSEKPKQEKRPAHQEEEKKNTSTVSVNPNPNNNTSFAASDDAAKAQKHQKNASPIIKDETAISNIKAYAKKNIKILDFPPLSAEDLTKHINVLFDDDSLDLMTISQIFEKAADLSRKEYVDMVIDNRKARRKVFFENQKKYSELVIEFLEDSENLINKCSDELLVALNISKELFENSCMTLMEKGFFQQMMMLQAAVKQKMKEFIPATFQLTIQEIKGILKYQLGIIKDEQHHFKDIINGLKNSMETVQMIPFGINIILSDLIYEKYGIEEEDQMGAMKDPYTLMKDQELHNLLMASEQTIQNMLASMGLMSGPEMMGGPGMF